MHTKVVASWTQSVSQDVDFLEVIWSLDGVDSPAVLVQKDFTELESPYEDADAHRVGVKVTVVGTNGLRSVTALAEIDVPIQPVAPLPVTNLVLNVVPVV